MRLASLFFLAAVVAATSAPALADAADWRFCVASDFQDHVAYLTPSFESNAAGKELEGRVGEMLTQEKLPFENVQCRLPTDLSQSLAQRDDAQVFVKAMGFELQSIK